MASHDILSLRSLGIAILVVIGAILFERGMKKFAVFLLRDHLRRAKLSLESYTAKHVSRRIVIEFTCKDSTGKIKRGEAEVIGLLVDVFWDKKKDA
jgi:hypothetical protein